MHQEPSTWEHHSPHTNRYLTATSQTNYKLKTDSTITTCLQKNRTTQSDTTAIAEKLQQLLITHKNQAHQVDEVQVVTPQPSTTWDLKAAAELLTTQEDQLE